MQKNFTLGGILAALILTMSTTQMNAHFATQWMAGFQNTIRKEFSSIPSLESSFSSMMMPCSGANGEIGGTVFGDYNKDGLDNQVGAVANVSVYIFGLDGSGNSQLISSTTTDENGDYSFTGLTDGANYRLEFVPPMGLTPGFSGDNNGTDVQFVTSPTCEADAAFSFPEDYCASTDEVPNMVIPCFVNSDPLAGDPDIANEETLVLFPYGSADNSPNPTTLAVASETGAIHGLTYSKSQQRLYTSAFVKRHVGLGPLGIGGIYAIDIADVDNPVVTQFLDVTTIGIDVGSIPSNPDRGLIPSDEDPDPSNDPLAFDGVGKLGIGAIVLSIDESTLWITNLHQQTIHSIVLDSDNNPVTAPTASDVSTFSFSSVGCSNGSFRPFALQYYRGNIYVGGVCDAASGTAVDLEAIVYRLDGSSFTEVLRFDLDYEKGYANKDGDCEMNTGWFPWRNDIPPACTSGGTFVTWPTPIFSDMEFDTDGSLIMGFMDRMGHQIGYRNYPLVGTTPLLQTVSGGDLLRAYNDNGTYILEANGTAGPNTTGGMGNMQGPGGGEYYYRDVFEGAIDNLTDDAQPHRETSQGGLALFPGSGEVSVTALDPYSTNFNVGGINWMNNQTGEVRNPGYRVFTTTSSNISTFQKANGLGDLIIQCAEAPLEIGGFIWDDDNQNGVQDPGETAISGVNVILYDNAGMPLAMTSTDANGNYYFNDDTPDLGTLQKNTNYFVAIGSDGQFDAGTGLLQGSFSLTVANMGMAPNTDFNDSDATIAGGSVAGGALTGFPYYEITTGGNGFVDHSNDVGFSRLTGISGYVWEDTDQDGIQDDDENGIEGVTVTLYDSNDNEVASVTTNSGGTYTITNIDAGNYYIVFDETTNTVGITNYQGTQQGAGDGTNDSDPDPNSGQTPNFNFDPNDGILTDLDAGFFTMMSNIEGFVWEDTDQDGIQDDGEDGIEGVTVTLYDSDDNEVASVTTDMNGNYVFVDVPSGNYYIIFDETTNTEGISDYQGTLQNTGDGTNDSDPDPNSGQTTTFNFDTNSGNLDDIDAGFFIPTNNIEGFVWQDEDEDGIQDDGEEGIEGVTVTLYDSDDNEIASATTDMNGNYVFVDIPSGNYYIVFDETTNTTGIPNYQGTLQNTGDGTNDSDPDPNSGQTVIFNFDATSGDLGDIDAGFFIPNGTLMGFAWHDADEDGVKDNGEDGIEGVSVELFTANGTSLGTTTTNASGMYMFTGVVAGEYYVVFDVSTNTANIMDYAGTLQNVGDDNFDSDADPNSGQTNNFSFNPDTNNDNVNAGYTLPIQTASIGDFAFLDFDKDGIQDDGDIGLANVAIILNGTDNSGNSVNRNTTTNANGMYLFEDVAPGTYSLTFGFPTDLNGIQRSPKDIGNNDNIDSDPDVTSGLTDAFTFDGTSNINHLDAGYFDNVPPTFPNPDGDVTLDCVDPELDNPSVPNAIDNLDNEVEVTLNEVVNNNGGLCDGSFVIVRTWTATDDFGNTTVYTQNISINDTEAPVLIGVPDDVTIDCADLPIPANVQATDNCDDNVEVDLMENMEGEGCARTLTRKWTATDDCGNMSMDTQLISLVDNSPPVISFIHPDLAGVMDGDTLYMEWTTDLPFGEEDAIAIDACQGEVEVSFYDFIQDAGVCAEDGYIWEMVCVWEATDPCGNTAQLTLVVYFVDTTPPVLSGVPDDITVDCEEVPENSATVTATDNCDDEVFVTYLEIVSGDTCFDYEVIRRWSAIDDCGNIVVEEQIITVLVDGLKIVGVPDDLFLDCDDEIPPPAEPTLLGDCYNPELLFEETILGDTCRDYKIIRQWTGRNDCGLVVTEVQSIFINVPDLEFLEFPEAINVDCDNIPPSQEPPLSQYCYDLMVEFDETIIGDTCRDYKIVRKWTAMNNCGQMAMTSQTITVEVPELELHVPDDITINCHDAKPEPFVPQVDMSCYDVQIDYVETRENASCEDEYKCIRTWKATNSCGDQVTATQMITIIDRTAPTLVINNPALVGVQNGDTIFVSCGEIPLINPEDATANDNCDPDPNVIFSEDITNSDDCDFDDFMIKMTCGWLAIDRCGNSTKFEFCIIVRDDTSPVIEGVPSNTSINASDGFPPVPTNIRATDDCTEQPLLTFSEIIETEAGQCGYTILRTWNASDECGNTTLRTQSILVHDVCNCPDIIVDDYVVKEANCNNRDGSIKVNPNSDPGIFEYALVPDVGTSNEVGNERYDLGPGSYLLLIYLPNVDDCIEKIYFDVGQGNCLDTMNVTIPDALSQICLDETVLDYQGNITNTSFCNVGSASSVLGTEINGECVSVQPASGFDGTETACVIHCFNGSSAECDTTFLIINVEPVVIPCELVATAEVNQPDCGAANGSIQLNVSGEVGSLNYQWSPNVSNSNSASNLGNGVYNITVTDQETECSTNVSVTITEPSIPNISPEDISVTHVTCPDNNDNSSIVSNVATAFTVIGEDGIVYGTTPVFDLPAGNYTISTTNADGCSGTLAATINQPDPWQLSTSMTPETCAGNDGSINIVINGGIQPYTWQWTPNVSSSNSASGLTAGVAYNVLITDGAACSTSLTNLMVTSDCNNNCSALGGTISTNAPTSFCIEDGNEDFVNTNVSGNFGNYVFVVTDDNGQIVLLSNDPVFNFEGEAEGNFSIIGVAHDGTLNDLQIGDNINNLAACFDLSNSISITALGGDDCTEVCNVSGGSIFTNDPTTLCVDDDLSDIVNISVTDNSGEYLYLVTNADSVILGMTSQAFFNLEGAGSGICLIWGLAFNGAIVNADVGQHILNIQGCIALSNPIEVSRLVGDDCNADSNCDLNAGTIATTDDTILCVDDDNPDIVSVSVSGQTGNYSYVLTSADSLIITVSNSPTFNFEGATAGVCLIWGLASEGDLSGGNEGEHILNLSGCFQLSTPIIIERNTGDDCEGNGPSSNIEICDNNIDDDNDGLVDCADPDCCGVNTCGELFEDESLSIGVPYCIGETNVCLDLSLNLTQLYDISVDGVAYDKELSACHFDTSLAYSYFAIPEQGANGPYMLNNWTVNGASFSGLFSDVDGLIDSMNRWDNTGIWIKDVATLSIIGGNPSSAYGSLSITQQADDATAVLELNTNFISQGTTLLLELGNYQLIFTHQLTGCKDSLQLEVVCQPNITSENIVVSLPLNETNTLCLDTLQLPGIVNNRDWTCLDEDDCSHVFFNTTELCIDYTGEAVGIDSIQFVVCDNLGYCDTTQIVIIVESLIPIAIIDTDSTEQGKAVVIDVLANDQLFGELSNLSLVDQANHGLLEKNTDYSIIYTPENTYCGTDAFSYKICNNMGCDTASVNLLVICGQPIPYAGFSPNGDGVNETFRIAGLEQFPSNELHLFNIWGTQVFYAKNYRNDWKGTWNNKDLPDGTYYYIFSYDGGKKMTGYVQIRR